MERRPTFKCNFCTESFASNHSLAAHRRWRHTSTRASSSKGEVDAAKMGKMHGGSSDYEMDRSKGKPATETREWKLQDRSDSDRASHNRCEAILALECPREFQCEECNMTLPTYQALCAHWLSHSNKQTSASQPHDLSIMKFDGPKLTEGSSSHRNIYTCIYCEQEFATGHAFGGHKRSRLCRSNYHSAPQSPPPSPPPPQQSPPPSPDRPSVFPFDLNKPPPSDSEE